MLFIVRFNLIKNANTIDKNMTLEAKLDILT